MAHHFDRANAEYIEGAISGSVPTGPPLTFGAWFRADDATQRHTIGGLTLDLNEYIELRARGDSGGDPLQFRIVASSAGTNVSTGNGFTANEWYLAVARYIAFNDYEVYLIQPDTMDSDVSNKGTGSTSRSSNNFDTIAVGRRPEVSGNEMDGDIGEFFVFDVDIGEEYVRLLGLGLSPLDVLEYRGNLTYYKTLQFDDIEYPNIGPTWTKNGTIDVSDSHPPIVRRRYFANPPGAAAGAGPQTVSPTVVRLNATIPAPSVAGSGAATVSPTVVRLNATIPAPSAAGSGTATVSPTVVSGVFNVQAPSVAGSGTATVSPTVVSAVFNVQAPTVSSQLVISPTVVRLNGTVIAPTVAGTGTATISPTVVSGVFNVIAPTVAGSGIATVSPTVVSAILNVIAPSVTAAAAQTISPTVVGLNATIPAPFISIGPFNIRPVLVELCSIVQASGWVRECHLGQPRALAMAPMSAAVLYIGQSIAFSTMTTLTTRYDAAIRLYTDAFEHPSDRAELDLSLAASQIATDILGAFTLSGKIREVDVGGQFGDAFAIEFGHEQIGDPGKMYRVAELRFGLVVNDTSKLRI